MNPGPLRRLTGALGLVALVPTAWLLAVEAITVIDAALRAGVTLVVVVALGRLIGWVLGGLAGSFERDADQTPGGALADAKGAAAPSPASERLPAER